MAFGWSPAGLYLLLSTNFLFCILGCSHNFVESFRRYDTVINGCLHMDDNIPKIQKRDAIDQSEADATEVLPESTAGSAKESPGGQRSTHFYPSVDAYPA